MNIYQNNDASGTFVWDAGDLEEESPYKDLIQLEGSGLAQNLEDNACDENGHLLTVDENDVDEDMII